MILDNETAVAEVNFEAWLSSTAERKLILHVLNVTNPEQVIQGEKPNLTIVGPYVYE